LPLTIFIFVLSACTNASAPREDGFISIEPTSLFEGETKKLEPHLGIIGGAVRVDYSGTYKALKASYEVWERGKLIASADSLGVSIKEESVDEVTISLKPDPEDENSCLVTIAFLSEEGGYSSSSFTIPRFDPEFGSGPIPLQRPIQLKEGKEAAVWGYRAVKDGSISTSSSLEETAKESDQAFLLKLSTDRELD